MLRFLPPTSGKVSPNPSRIVEKFKAIREISPPPRDQEAADQFEDAGRIREIAKEIQGLLGPDPGEESPVVQDRGCSPGGTC